MNQYGWICHQCGMTQYQAGHVCQNQGTNPFWQQQQTQLQMHNVAIPYSYVREIAEIHQKLDLILKKLEEMK